MEKILFRSKATSNAFIDSYGFDLPAEFSIQTTVPTYLKYFIDTTDSIFFLFKQIMCEESSPIIKSTAISKDKELDLTGSPLELALADESFNDEIDICDKIKAADLWAGSEEGHSPISQIEATEWMNKCHWAKVAKNDKEQWIWSLIDCNSLVLIGTKVCNGWWHNAQVQILPKIWYNEIDLKLILDKHLQMARIQSNNLLVNISTEYDLTANLSIRDALGLDISDVENSVKAHIQWKKLSLTVPLEDSKTILKQKITIGHYLSEAHRLWVELCTVQKLYDMILNNRNMTLNSLHDITMPNKIRNENLFNELQTILCKTEYCEEVFEDQLVINLSQVLNEMNKRPSYNFCDSLWLLLKDCTTYGELLDCLNEVFSEIADGTEDLKLNENHPSRLGSLLQDLKLNRAAIPCLTGLQPLELLLEIGIEKLCQDYIHIFKKCELSNIPLPFYEIPEEIEPVNKKISFKPRLTVLPGTNPKNDNSKPSSIFQNSRFDAWEYSHKFKILSRAHIILEYLLISYKAFDLDLDNLHELYMELTGVVLLGNNSEYKPPSDIRQLMKNANQTISIPIATKHVLPAINKKNPTYILATFETETKMRKLTSKFYFDTRNIFPPSIYQPRTTQDDVPEENDILYHATHFIMAGSCVPM